MLVGQVPLEDVDLEACEEVNLLLEFFHAEVGTPYVVHETAYLEGRPVHDDGTGQLLLVVLQHLLQGLQGADDACACHRLDGDGL